MRQSTRPKRALRRACITITDMTTDRNDRPTPDMPRQFQEPFLLIGLERGESHGYELAEYLRGLNMPIDLATVYRKLQSMERRELIISRWEESPSGPKRRVYRLTDAGVATAQDAVKELEEVVTMVSCALNTPAPVK